MSSSSGAIDYSEYLKTRRWTGWIYRRFYLYPRLARHLKGRVLDIGCGIGDFLAYRPGTVGVDINQKAVKHCSFRGFEVHLLNNHQFPFQNGSFDAALLDNVLEHVSQPGPLLGEIRRVLKPHGTLLVGVPGIRGFQHDADHKVFYDRRSLIETMGHNGFSPLAHFCTPFASRFLDKRLRQYCLYGTFQTS